MFELLGYTTYEPEPLDVDDLDLNETDAPHVKQVYLMNEMNFGHTLWLYEVADTSLVRLRGLAYDAMQRAGSHLLVITKDYQEVIFVHPYFAGGNKKSHLRVNKLKVIVNDPTRHDVDTINALHAHGRNATEIYQEQNKAFNITNVTKKFYSEYRDHFERAKQMIVQHNKGIREFQTEDQADKLHAFTQRLMGRLMFLYFLQRKGWLGGQADFLTRRYRICQSEHSHEIDSDETFYYYREVLEPLFFETMNQERPGNVTRWQGVKIPYLNGGLFDQGRDPAGIISLPDSLFDPMSNEGLLAFFNRYNFTIADDTPHEQDVAVDPEMLGKVFENMLEEDDRGKSGSFYTPRAIVSYMCQEALAGYLEESAGIPRDETRLHFDPDADVTFTPEQGEKIAEALDTLTVLDPAVGSGSFLIGMMNEILTIRKAITPPEAITPTQLAEWKEAIIQNTLYGVDIKPEAIEIAQLRLWLALVVNQTLEQARPLPNLDYKLMAGNSLIETIDGEPVLGETALELIGSELAPEQPKLFGFAETEKEQKRMDELRREFFNASPTRRKELREELQYQERRIVEVSLQEKGDAQQQIIDQLGKKAGLAGGKLKTSDERKLKKAVEKLTRLTQLQEDLHKPDKPLPFFLYKLHFSDVFEKKSGFDIVVANPPYVRGEKLGDQKIELQASYPNVYKGTADLFVYFFERAYRLLKPYGQMAFITSNKYLRASYGKGLRKFLSEFVQLNTIVDLGDLAVFDAVAYPCIVMAERKKPNNSEVMAIPLRSINELEDLYNSIKSRATLFEQQRLGSDTWQIVDASTYSVLQKLEQDTKPLVKFLNGQMYRGIITGLNDAFVIDKITRSRLIQEDPNSAELIKPWLRGKDVKRWTVESEDVYVIAIQNSNDRSANNLWGNAVTEHDAIGIFEKSFPSVYSHLIRYEDSLRPRSDQGKWWWELRACAFYSEFENSKIVWGNLATKPQFTIDEQKMYVSAPANFISSDKDTLSLLLGFLNSNVTHWLVALTGATRQHGYIEYKPMYIEQIPIPTVSESLGKQLANVAIQCLDVAQDNPEKLPELEAKLNALVYQAYGLDEDDIQVIEDYLENK